MSSSLDNLFRWWRVKKIIKYIPANSIVCDIGCNSNAYFLKNVSNLVKYGVGLDKNVKDYRELKFELKQVNISKKVPLESEKFDVVVLIAVLEHLDYPKEILNEALRILRDGGRLILTTPTPLAKPILEILAKLNLINKKDIQEHKNYFWPKEIRKMLLGSGFKEENIKNHFFEFYLNELIIAKK